MSCCGGKRSNFHSPGLTTRPMGVSQLQNPVSLIFTGPGSLAVRGSATGLTYTFQRAVPQQVDARDAELLVKTGKFLKK